MSIRETLKTLIPYNCPISKYRDSITRSRAGKPLLPLWWASWELSASSFFSVVRQFLAIYKAMDQFQTSWRMSSIGSRRTRCNSDSCPSSCYPWFRPIWCNPAHLRFTSMEISNSQNLSSKDCHNLRKSSKCWLSTTLSFEKKEC